MWLLIIQFSPVSYYFLPLRPKNLIQQTVIDYPQPMFFSLTWDTMFYTHIKESHSCVYFNIHT